MYKECITCMLRAERLVLVKFIYVYTVTLSEFYVGVKMYLDQQEARNGCWASCSGISKITQMVPLMRMYELRLFRVVGKMF